MNVIIHIGFGKTGTTSIQDELSKKEEVLGKKCWLYPRSGRVGTGHHVLAPLGTHFDEVKHEFESLKSELHRNLECDVVISSEFLSYAKKDFVKALLDCFPLEASFRIIFYVREQVSLIESTYLQFQKMGYPYCNNILEFYQQHRPSFKYIDRLKLWVEIFGRDSVEIYLFDKHVIGDDVRAHFFSLMSLSESDIGGMSEEFSNLSILPEFSDLVRLIDESVNMDSDTRIKIINELLSSTKQFKACSNKKLIGPLLESEIRKYYYDSNLELIKTFELPSVFNEKLGVS